MPIANCWQCDVSKCPGIWDWPLTEALWIAQQYRNKKNSRFQNIHKDSIGTDYICNNTWPLCWYWYLLILYWELIELENMLWFRPW
jgi:hypothetical protein